MLAFTLIFTGIFTFSNCDKIRNLRTTELIETIAPLRQDTCYVVGYHGCAVVTQDSTAKIWGCLFISEDLNDTLYAFIESSPLIDSVNSFFSFPAKIISPHGIWGGCGFNPFPEEYRFAYKVLITYRPMTEEEKMHATYLFCFYQGASYYFFDAKYIAILSITKIQ